MSDPEAEFATVEQRRLFAPPFMAAVVHAGTSGFVERADEPIPLGLAVFIPVVVLHAPTRRAFPSRITRDMRAWIRENRWALTGIEERRRDLLEFTLPGIRTGLAHGMLTADGARLRAQPWRLKPRFQHGDNVEVLKKSEFIGRWIGSQDLTTAEILTMWNVEI